MSSNLGPVDGSLLPDIGLELLLKRKRPAADTGMQEVSSRKILVFDG